MRNAGHDPAYPLTDKALDPRSGANCGPGFDQIVFECSYHHGRGNLMRHHPHGCCLPNTCCSITVCTSRSADQPSEWQGAPTWLTPSMCSMGHTNAPEHQLVLVRGEQHVPSDRLRC